MPICQKCQSTFSNRILIEGKVRILNSRKYCLECSPFLSHNTKKIHISIKPKDEKFCTSCKETHPSSEFYRRRQGNDLSSYCKKCTVIQTQKRQRKLKEQSIQYKGGECVKCGYNKCQAALQFHHVDKTKKEFTLAHRKVTSFVKVKDELDKCILLCANCHAEEHYQG